MIVLQNDLAEVSYDVVLGGSPDLVVMGGDSLKVVGSNLVTVNWMDIFSHIFVVKIVMMFV